MKAFHIDGAAGLESLVLRDAPEPRSGRHEVLVRLHARSLNSRDVLILQAAIRSPPNREPSPRLMEMARWWRSARTSRASPWAIGWPRPVFLAGGPLDMLGGLFGCTRDGMLAPGGAG
jgi:hypothetical protein